jgi:ADP-heptose:LPS heptosyltransferase
MRALFLIPGDAVRQLQALPAVAATAQQLKFQIQVACPASVGGVWELVPTVEKVIPFNYSDATLADWTNLMGSVRDPDFQACINLAQGRQVDLMLSMSHIPKRLAASGFSATEKVKPLDQGWPPQRLAPYLVPIGVQLDAQAFRLLLPKSNLEKASKSLPPGNGPVLLVAPEGGPQDWPRSNWGTVTQQIQLRLKDLRLQQTLPPGAPWAQKAAQVASSDVVLASDPVSIELALLCGVPLVALGSRADDLPVREGVTGLGGTKPLAQVSVDNVLGALGLG